MPIFTFFVSVPGSTCSVSKFVVPYWGIKVVCGIGMPYRPYSLCIAWRAGTYDNPMPLSTLSSQSGIINWASILHEPGLCMCIRFCCSCLCTWPSCTIGGWRAMCMNCHERMVRSCTWTVTFCCSVLILHPRNVSPSSTCENYLMQFSISKIL